MHKLIDLPLGSRFRYFGTDNKQTYVLLERHGCGKVVNAPEGFETAPQFQGIYSAAETPIEMYNLLVELVPVQEVP